MSPRRFSCDRVDGSAVTIVSCNLVQESISESDFPESSVFTLALAAPKA